MKVIVTEQQLRDIILNEKIEASLLKSLNESIDFSDLKRKIKKALIGGMAFATMLTVISKLSVGLDERNALLQYAKRVNTEINSDKNMDSVMTQLSQDSAFQAKQDSIQRANDSIIDLKIDACREYMTWAMKNQGYDWSTTDLTPEAIVCACEENNFSLPFTMAVANLESCFGQTARAKRTNSVFSVGAYDDGKDKCLYKSQDESIVPFINLIKNDYMQNGKKTLDDLLNPGSLVNMNGHRYAGGQNYESQVKSIMNRIVRMYPILGS